MLFPLQSPPVACHVLDTVTTSRIKQLLVCGNVFLFSRRKDHAPQDPRHEPHAPHYARVETEALVGKVFDEHHQPRVHERARPLAFSGPCLAPLLLPLLKATREVGIAAVLQGEKESQGVEKGLHLCKANERLFLVVAGVVFRLAPIQDLEGGVGLYPEPFRNLRLRVGVHLSEPARSALLSWIGCMSHSPVGGGEVQE